MTNNHDESSLIRDDTTTGSSSFASHSFVSSPTSSYRSKGMTSVSYTSVASSAVPSAPSETTGTEDGRKELNCYRLRSRSKVANSCNTVNQSKLGYWDQKNEHIAERKMCAKTSSQNCDNYYTRSSLLSTDASLDAPSAPSISLASIVPYEDESYFDFRTTETGDTGSTSIDLSVTNGGTPSGCDSPLSPLDSYGDCSVEKPSKSHVARSLWAKETIHNYDAVKTSPYSLNAKFKRKNRLFKKGSFELDERDDSSVENRNKRQICAEPIRKNDEGIVTAKAVEPLASEDKMHMRSNDITRRDNVASRGADLPSSSLSTYSPSSPPPPPPPHFVRSIERRADSTKNRRASHETHLRSNCKKSTFEIPPPPPVSPRPRSADGDNVNKHKMCHNEENNSFLSPMKPLTAQQTTPECERENQHSRISSKMKSSNRRKSYGKCAYRIDITGDRKEKSKVSQDILSSPPLRDTFPNADRLVLLDKRHNEDANEISEVSAKCSSERKLQESVSRRRREAEVTQESSDAIECYKNRDSNSIVETKTDSNCSGTTSAIVISDTSKEYGVAEEGGSCDGTTLEQSKLNGVFGQERQRGELMAAAGRNAFLAAEFSSKRYGAQEAAQEDKNRMGRSEQERVRSPVASVSKDSIDIEATIRSSIEKAQIGLVQRYEQQVERLEQELSNQRKIRSQDADDKIRKVDAKHMEIQRGLEIQISRLRLRGSSQLQASRSTVAVPNKMPETCARKLSIKRQSVDNSQQDHLVPTTQKQKKLVDQLRSYYLKQLAEMTKKHEAEMGALKDSQETKTGLFSCKDCKPNNALLRNNCPTEKILDQTNATQNKGDGNQQTAVLQLMLDNQKEKLQALQAKNQSCKDSSRSRNVLVQQTNAVDGNRVAPVHSVNQASVSTMTEINETKELQHQILELQTEKVTLEALAYGRSQENERNASRQNDDDKKCRQQRDSAHLVQVAVLRRSLDESQVRVIHLQNQVDTLQSINASLRLQTASSIVSDSTLARYANLSRKVEELDHRAASREKALQRVVKDAQEQHQRETERLVNLHQEELREKDDDIRNCKMQIDKWKKAVVLSSESQNAITRYSSAI